MKEKIKALIKERLYNSFAAALIKLISTPHLILKLLLGVFALGSSGLASYMVVQSIFSYLDYGASSTSRTIYESPTLFPKVTFCNVNKYATQYAYNLSMSGVDIQFLTNEEKKKLGRDLENCLVSCQFNLLVCDPSDFVWSFDPWFGNCFTFNSGFDSNGNQTNLKQSTIAGYKFGLQVSFYVNIYEELLDFNLNSLNGLGLIIRIGNSSYSTFSDTNGLFIAPGQIAFISVDREFKSILPKPYSTCEIESNAPKYRADSDIYNLIGDTNYVYSQQLCLTQCLQKRLIKNYNCTFSFLPSLFNMSNCDQNSILASRETNFNSDYINNVCLPLCPLECSQATFKTSISSIQLNGLYYEKYIQLRKDFSSDFILRKIDANAAEKSFVEISIYYDSLSFEESTESPQMNMVSLLGSIGGNLGLFLGVSVFSLCELIEVCIEIVLIWKERIHADNI